MTTTTDPLASRELYWHGAPVATEREILRVVVGSNLHGLALEGQDDLDLMGIYVEPAEDVCGLDPLSERLPAHYTARTQPDGARSGPGDVDLTVYSLRRYMSLASHGHPTMLLPLWAQGDAIKAEHDPYASTLRAIRDNLITIEAGKRFAGYLKAQREKLLGERGNRTNRPELAEVHGYDTKFAAHAIRLGLQGSQLLVDGELHLPMDDADRERVMRVRRGELSLGQVVWQIERLEWQLASLIADATFEGWWPEAPDRPLIREVSAEIHLAYWAEVDGR
jgi:hypothetical protein